MTASLTSDYLWDHQDEVAKGGMRSSAEEFGDALIDAILEMARQQLGAESTDEINLEVSVRVRPVEVEAPLGGCVEICVGGPPVWVCYHRNFKGKRPGPGASGQAQG